MKIWNDDEVLELFQTVEKCKNDKNALKNAFALHAKKYKRQPNSVRNYYYHEVDNLQKDKIRGERLGVDLSKHTKNHFKSFEKEEEKNLLDKIDSLTCQGLSVRSACQKLADGDLTLMTRLQNKYQNLKKEKTKKSNIIMFHSEQKVLTDSDINSLFWGLVKLIKKNALDEFLEKNKLKEDSSSFLLKKAFVDLSKKDKQISALREEFEELKKENQKLTESLSALKIDKKQILEAHLAKRKLQTETDSKKL